MGIRLRIIWGIILFWTQLPEIVWLNYTNHSNDQRFERSEKQFSHLSLNNV